MNMSLKGENELQSFEENQFVYLKDAPSDHLYIVKQGKVLIFSVENKRVVPLSVAGTEVVFGEVEVFQDIPRTSYAYTLEYTELIVVPKRDILSVLNLCPQWVTNIMQTLARRLQNVGELLTEHKITDDRFSEEAQLSPSDEANIWKTLGNS